MDLHVRLMQSHGRLAAQQRLWTNTTSRHRKNALHEIVGRGKDGMCCGLSGMQLTKALYDLLSGRFLSGLAMKHDRGLTPARGCLAHVWLPEASLACFIPRLIASLRAVLSSAFRTGSEDTNVDQVRV